MKKFTIVSVAVLTLVLAASTIHAEEQGDWNGGAPSGGQTMPPPQGQMPQSIKDKLRSDYENRMKNLKNNEDTRGKLLEDKKIMSSTTKMMGLGPNGKMPIKPGDIRPGMMGSTTWASSTKAMREDFRENMRDAREDRKELRKDVFEMQKNHIIQELKRALENLKQVRARIQSRIEKAEQSGRTMTEPKKLLVIADAKIVSAENAINSLSAVSSTSTPPTATTTPGSVDLGKPRQVAESAHKALKDAQKALNDVVVSIAKNMGLKLGQNKDGRNATSTATTTAQ